MSKKMYFEVKPYIQNKGYFEAIVYSADHAVLAQRAEFGDYQSARQWAQDEIDRRSY